MELWTGELSRWKCTDPIWRVLASSDGISSWIPLKPQHSNPNPTHLANQLWFIDFLTPPHLSSSLTDSLPSLNLLCHSKTDARFMQDGRKSSLKLSIRSVAFFSSLRQRILLLNRSSKVSSRPDYILKFTSCDIRFSRVYSKSCCSCSFEREIIKIGQS